MADDFNKLPNIIKELDIATGELVAILAQNIALEAAQHAPVNTGFMQSSIYYTTSKESTYGQGVGSPTGDATLLPEIPKPTKPTDAYVAVGASYGAYVEFGTAHDPSQPYLIPAKDKVEADIENYAKKYETFLEKAI